MWLVKATAEVLHSFGMDSLDGEIFLHNFTDNYALVKHHFCWRFFMKRGFQDVTPPAMAKEESPLERVMVLRWGATGDLLMLTPALKALKEQHPKLWITLMARPGTRDILFYNPHINQFTSCLFHEVPFHIDLYDQVWDLTHSIEENPLAEIENAYDIAFDWLQLDRETVAREDMKPEVYLTQLELERGKEILASLGIFRGDSLVAIHSEASSDLRTWPQGHLEEFVCNLKDEGYKILLLGLSPELETLCDGERVISLIKKYSIREVVTILKQPQIRLLVATDSSFAHIGAALGIPMLLLYGPFDPYTRAKYFQNCSVIFKSFRCAPCHVHGEQCKFGSPAPCMENIKPEDVFSAALAILEEGESGLDFVFKAEDLKKFEVKEKACPICGSEDSHLRKRYGNFAHLQCEDCGHIFTDKVPQKVDDYDHEYYQDIYKSERLVKESISRAEEVIPIAERLIYPAGGKGTILDVGCGIGTLLSRARELDWKTQGIDISKAAVSYAIEHYELPGLTVGDFESNDKQWEDKSVEFVYLSHVQEHFKDPIKAFTKIKTILKDNGVIFMFTPDAGQAVGGNWHAFNTFFAGEHLNIFSQKSLIVLCEKVGFEILEFKINGSASSFEAWIKKK